MQFLQNLTNHSQNETEIIYHYDQNNSSSVHIRKEKLNGITIKCGDNSRQQKAMPECT